MKYSLPILLCLLFAQPWVAPRASAQLPVRSSDAPTQQTAAPAARTARVTTPQPPPPRISGDALLRRVMAAVDALPSLSARMRYQVNLKDRSALGTGIYLQQGRGLERQMCWDMTLQTPPIASRLRHVSDGVTLWMMEELAGEVRFSKVDLTRLRRARPKSGGTVDAGGWLSLGGLPKLLAGLDAGFQFHTVSENRLDNLRVWTLVGTWENGRLSDLLPDQKDAIAKGGTVDFTRLSAQLPTSVVLHVGCDDFVPYQLEYWRHEGASTLTANEGEGQLLVIMELFEVRLGAAIDAAKFAFTPAEGTSPADRTGEFLERFGLEEAAGTGARRTVPPRR
ncbi:MAG: hypothetical protein AB7O59_22520 [Pirellulales bacterium]